jgi:hypothetical protein
LRKEISSSSKVTMRLFCDSIVPFKLSITELDDDARKPPEDDDECPGYPVKMHNSITR